MVGPVSCLLRMAYYYYSSVLLVTALLVYYVRQVRSFGKVTGLHAVTYLEVRGPVYRVYVG